jgi:hypothetical protein
VALALGLGPESVLDVVGGDRLLAALAHDHRRQLGPAGAVVDVEPWVLWIEEVPPQTTP